MRIFENIIEIFTKFRFNGFNKLEIRTHFMGFKVWVHFITNFSLYYQMRKFQTLHSAHTRLGSQSFKTGRSIKFTKEEWGYFLFKIIQIKT